MSEYQNKLKQKTQCLVRALLLQQILQTQLIQTAVELVLTRES